MKRTNEFSVKDLCNIAICTAIIAVLAQVSIPMPAGVPMTLQTFAIPLIGILIGSKKGFWSTVIYLLLGAVGVPVFAGFSGGLGILLGMTGGFLISFPLMAWLAGLGFEMHNRTMLIAGLVVGAVINYVIGMVWFVIVADSDFVTAFTACVLPFIPTAIIKVILAGVIGTKCRGLLVRANVLTA